MLVKGGCGIYNRTFRREADKKCADERKKSLCQQKGAAPPASDGSAVLKD